MIDAVRPESVDSKQLMQGWGLSLLLHFGLALTAVTVMPKMTIVLEQEPFRWEVALVEPWQEPLRQEIPAPTPTVKAPQPTRTEPVRPVEPTPEMVMPRVAPQQSSQMIHPVIEPPTPQQPVQPVQEIAQIQAKLPEPQEIKKLEAKEPEPVVKEVVKQEPVRETVREVTPVVEPVAPTYTYQAPAPSASPSATEHHQGPVAVASAPSAPAEEPAPITPSSSPVVAAPHISEEAPSPVVAPPLSPTIAEPPVQVAKAAPQTAPQTTEAKADHRWVGESLWRRVAELKRYPSSARLNGLEGRVVLKAVIRADGHLAEVSVLKSSGHAVLDAAAMEAVKLACPLHMKHPIGPPQIVVSLPIVYSLAN